MPVGLISSVASRVRPERRNGMQSMPFPREPAERILRAAPGRREARGGASDTFSVEAVTHLPALTKFALRLSRNQQDAADLVQNTFLRALQSQHRFQPGTRLRAWLFTILHNLNANRVRDASRPMVDFDEDQVSRVAALRSSRTENPEAYLHHRLVRGEIQRALETLPPKLRLVVVLADLEGLSYREIAKICGCPIGTVMSRLCRGRQALRVALKEYGGSGNPSLLVCGPLENPRKRQI